MHISRRKFLQKSAVVGATLAGFPVCVMPGQAANSGGRIPIILATDIGDDIDDTWALGFLLKCPELSLKLVATEYGRAPYRAKLLGKFLQTTGHAHIPIGVGPEDVEPRGEGPLAAWI